MNVLENAKPENCFYCIDGSVLHNLRELEQKLRLISSQAFYHHVNQSKNDFYNWVRDVFQDHELANELLKAKTPAEAADVVKKHLRKALLAKKEIENAINEALKPAKTALKKLKTRVTAAAKPAAFSKIKNRKVNKKQKRRTFLKKSFNKKTKRTKTKIYHLGSRKKTLLHKKTQRKAQRSNSRGIISRGVKKQVTQWLKWLNIAPKL